MDQQQFTQRIYPIYDSGDFEGFITEYDRCIDELGGIELCETDLHIVAHGCRILRWSALEQISDQATLLQDMQRFLVFHADSELVIQLICSLIEDQSMERLLPLLEVASPKPLGAFKSMVCRIAAQSNDMKNYLSALDEFDALPTTKNEKQVRVILENEDLRFDEEHVSALRINELPENNTYLQISAERDGNRVELAMPMPGNNAICEEGNLELNTADQSKSYTLNRNNSSRYFILSPYGYRYKDSNVSIQVSNIKLCIKED